MVEMTLQQLLATLKKCKLEDEYHAIWCEVREGHTQAEAERLANERIAPEIEKRLALLAQMKADQPKKAKPPKPEKKKQIVEVPARRRSTIRDRGTVLDDIKWVYNHVARPADELERAKKHASGGALTLLAQAQNDNRVLVSLTAKLLQHEAKTLDEGPGKRKQSTMQIDLCYKLLTEAKKEADGKRLEQGSAKGQDSEPQVSNLPA